MDSSALQTPGFFSPRLLIDISYFLTAVLFILGLKRMSSPVTARSGIIWAGAGMVVATLVSFLYPGMSNYELIIAAIVVGSLVAWWSGKKVAMTDMPQMIALYNGMGGGAAAAIAAVELYRAAFANVAGEAAAHSNVVMSLAVVGGIIGAISFSGSLIAWAKLQGVLNKTVRFGGQKFVNGLPWAHLDIAGVAWKKPSADPTIPDGASGFGVRLLNRLVADNYEG